MAKRRIVGQCGVVDFKHLEHLAGWVREGKDIDLSTLTKNQQNAILILYHFQECGVSFDVLLKVREVLIWQYEGGGYAFEYKLFDPRDRDTGMVLRSMKKIR